MTVTPPSPIPSSSRETPPSGASRASGTEGRPIYLTGIKPTGEPHIGNYFGAIRPALEAAGRFETFYFIADYHALTSMRDPDELRHNTRAVAATWLACGLDPERTVLYRQSALPETFELTWILSCLTGKGLMNRAHAYKAARDRNEEAGTEDLDAGINMGLFNYPILMAVDILLMEANLVPVGRDQAQHVEYAADIAGSYNHLFGRFGYSFPIPQGVFPEGAAAVLPGLDGRKMSKSYDNHLPLFLPEKELRKRIRRIPTDATGVDEPKDPEGSIPFRLLTHFASPEKVREVDARLRAGGMGWGALKDELFEAANAHLSPLRDRYDALMEPDSPLDGILEAGAEKARVRARRVLASVRAAVGIDAANPSR